jgi:AcrR family transcriptional regulator
MNSEERREQIARAALRIIGEQGVRGLSLSSVARRVGLVPSAIYRHFSSKEELLDHILESFRESVLANVKLVKGQTSDPLEQMRRLLMRHVELIRENEGIPRILFSEDVHRENSLLKGKLLGVVKTLLEEVEGMLSEGKKMGLVRKDLDLHTGALLFLGIFQPGAVLWHLTGGTFDVTRHAKRAWELFLRAVKEDR